MTDTELKLKFWRGDQIGAERLSAIILHIDGFSSVDPQCPLGGPDGLKDFLCEKNGWNYVAAAYFPNSEQKFKSVQDKFLHDLDGVAKNSADGIVFLTNQSLTPGERDVLLGLAEAKGHKSVLYHLERIRSLLDSPSGYGARLEFLSIGMTQEEQFSFFSQWNRSFQDQLHSHGLMIIREISKKIDQASGMAEKYGARFNEVSDLVKQTYSLITASVPPSDKKKVGPSDFVPRGKITISDLCILHSALLFDAPSGAQVGRLRTQKIWISGPGGTPETANFVPPLPELVPDLLSALLSDWRESYDVLSNASDREKISGITKFHHRFLSIHPFMDGNGRMARFLLAQQARELLNIDRTVVVEDRRPYFDALSQADAGDYAALETQMTQAILGTELIAGSPSQM